jgi:hypothetical protein
LAVRLVHQMTYTLDSLHLSASDVEEGMSTVSRASSLEIRIDARRAVDLGWAKPRPQIRSKRQLAASRMRRCRCCGAMLRGHRCRCGLEVRR